MKDESRNISPFAIWLGGEELKSKESAAASDVYMGEKWYEVDIGWVYIRVLQFFGLAEVKYARV